MRIGLDLDGVVFDSETTFRTYEYKNSPANKLMELMKQICATN